MLAPRISDLYADQLREKQLDALIDFSACLMLGEKKGGDGLPVVPLRMLYDQFVVLATRNAVLARGNAREVLGLLSETHVRNAFPRESRPAVEGLPKFTNYLRAEVVVDRNDRTGYFESSRYYRTGLDQASDQGEVVPADVNELPVAEPSAPGGVPGDPMHSMRKLTNIMIDQLVALGRRAEAHDGNADPGLGGKLPFDPIRMLVD